MLGDRGDVRPLGSCEPGSYQEITHQRASTLWQDHIVFDRVSSMDLGSQEQVVLEWVTGQVPVRELHPFIVIGCEQQVETFVTFTMVSDAVAGTDLVPDGSECQA